jgi:hypothetical protein
MAKAEIWLRGMAAAVISGGANGAITGFAAIGIDPSHFNLAAGFGHTLSLAGVSSTIGAGDLAISPVQAAVQAGVRAGVRRAATSHRRSRPSPDRTVAAIASKGARLPVLVIPISAKPS